MKAVRLKTFQVSANFKEQINNNPKTTYPLPPASTVVGFVHFLCKWKEYHPLKVSIGGDYASANNYGIQTTVQGFGSRKAEKQDEEFENRWTYKFNHNGRRYGYVKAPIQVCVVTDLSLILHIIPENQEEVEEICNAIKNPHTFPSLGRYEDLVDIREVKIVDVLENKLTETKNKYWLPKKSINVENRLVNDDNTVIEDTSKIGGTLWYFAKEYKLSKKHRVWLDRQGFYLFDKYNKIYSLVDINDNPVILI